MDSTSQLELLPPETRDLIIDHISSVTTLGSLIRALPRFYEVFRSRREYHLSEFAEELCGFGLSAWAAINASKLARPLSDEARNTFMRTFRDENYYGTSTIPSDTAIPMIRLGACVEWFVADFARFSILNMTRLGQLLGLVQNIDWIQHELIDVELDRAEERSLASKSSGTCANLRGMICGTTINQNPVWIS